MCSELPPLASLGSSDLAVAHGSCGPCPGQARASVVSKRGRQTGFGSELQALPVVSHMASRGAGGGPGVGRWRLGGCSAHVHGRPRQWSPHTGRAGAGAPLAGTLYVCSAGGAVLGPWSGLDLGFLNLKCLFLVLGST